MRFGLNTNFNASEVISAIPFSQCGPRGTWGVADASGNFTTTPPTPATLTSKYDPTENSRAKIFNGTYPFPAGTYTILGGDAVGSQLIGTAVTGQVGTNPPQFTVSGTGTMDVWCPNASGGGCTVWLPFVISQSPSATGGLDVEPIDRSSPYFATDWQKPIAGIIDTLRVVPDWFQTNNAWVGPNAQKTWIPDFFERSKIFENALGDSSWGDRDGVPWSLPTRAGRVLNCNVWSGVVWWKDFDPTVGIQVGSDHLEYVNNFGDFMRNSWQGGSHTLIIELGNEVWNTGFFAGNDAIAQSTAFGDMPPSPGKAYGRQAAHVYTKLKDRFDLGGMGPYEFVLMGHNVNPTFIQDAVTGYNSVPGAPALAAVGCASYTVISSTKRTEWINTINSGGTVTVAEVHAELMTNTPTTINGVTNHKATADANGLKTYVYEGGESLIETFSALQNLYITAAADSGIYDVAEDLMTRLDAAGVDLYVAYNYMQPHDGSGTWGHWRDLATIYPDGQAWLDMAAASAPGGGGGGGGRRQKMLGSMGSEYNADGMYMSVLRPLGG